MAQHDPVPQFELDCVETQFESWEQSIQIEADSFALPHSAQPFGHFLHSLHRAEVEKTIVVEQQRKKSFLFSFEIIFVGPSIIVYSPITPNFIHMHGPIAAQVNHKD